MKITSMRILLIATCLLAVSCSTTNSQRAANDIETIRAYGPFRLVISADSPQIEKLLAGYINVYFGRNLSIGEPSKSSIEVLFTTHDQENAYSKWQNSTMILVIKSNDGKRLWTGEYNYKGGMELSSFTVNSPAEAAKLVTERIAKMFESDYSL